MELIFADYSETLQDNQVNPDILGKLDTGNEVDEDFRTDEFDDWFSDNAF